VDAGDLLKRFGREFPRGTVLFREGDPGREMYVVHRGKVGISARVGAVEKVLSTLGQGEFFGEMSILNDAPRSATATCLEDCLLLVVDARTFEAMVRASSEIALRMIQKMAARLAEADRQIENLLLRDARARVVHFVAGEADRHPGATLALDPADLAARLDVDAGQAAEVLRTLERSGLLAGTPGAWTVPDADRLRHFLDLLQLDVRAGNRP
jgi:CRP/FNR family transcriptional regulator, cyclic AMP receptor protein